jgi:hypothetical protein
MFLLTNFDQSDLIQKSLPNLRNPRTLIMIPVRKVSKTTNAGPLFACSEVINAIMAVGPTVMSLQLPNIKYMKQPMKAEYKPY